MQRLRQHHTRQLPRRGERAGQYGPRVAAAVVYLLHYQFVPEHRLAALMADLFALSLSRASIAQMSARAAQRLAGFADTVRDMVAKAPVKHLDKTGFRIGGRTNGCMSRPPRS